jgi:hypothetical protein
LSGRQGAKAFRTPKGIEPRELALEFTSQPFVTRILVLVGYLSPILEQSVLLELDQAVPSGIQEPAPRRLRFFHHPEAGTNGPDRLIESLRDWVDRWMYLDLRVAAP